MANAGRLYLWRYLEGTKNFPGWHLTADEAGCDRAVALLGSLDGEYTLPITPPTPAILQVPSNRGGAARSRSPRKLTLAPGPAGNDTFWRLQTSADRVRLEMGPGKALELREGLEDIRRGEGDYAIGPEDDLWAEMCLWFWWYHKDDSTNLSF